MAVKDKRAAPRPKKAEVLHGISDPRLIAAYAAAQPWLRRPNVTGVGIGLVRVGGKATSEVGLCVHVTRRVANKNLTEQQRFPRYLLGVRVDVVEANMKPHLSDEEVDVRRRIASIPLRPGVLMKSSGGEMGTVALLVKGRMSGTQYILGSGHVMDVARSFFQPNSVAKDRLSVAVERVERSLGDAGIASFTGRARNNEPIGSARRITSTRTVRLGDRLSMSGAFSGITVGVVDWIGQKTIDYDGGVAINVPGFQMHPELAGTPLTQRGDSGALWFDDAGAGVGINIGGKGGTAPWAFASHLVDMMSLFGVEL